MRPFRYSPALPRTPPFTLGDGIVLLALASLLYVGARLALRAPAVIAGPDISLSFSALPWYAFFPPGAWRRLMCSRCSSAWSTGTRPPVTAPPSGC